MNDERGQLVRVKDRTELGEVIEEGKLFGGTRNIRAVLVHFPESGAISYYERRQVEFVES